MMFRLVAFVSASARKHYAQIKQNNCKNTIAIAVPLTFIIIVAKSYVRWRCSAHAQYEAGITRGRKQNQLSKLECTINSDD